VVRGRGREQHPFYVNVLCCFWIGRGRLLLLVAERLRGGVDGYASSWKIMKIRYRIALFKWKFSTDDDTRRGSCGFTYDI